MYLHLPFPVIDYRKNHVLTSSSTPHVLVSKRCRVPHVLSYYTIYENIEQFACALVSYIYATMHQCAKYVHTKHRCTSIAILLQKLAFIRQGRSYHWGLGWARASHPWAEIVFILMKPILR